tara:strand:+ start:8253 stop:9125 length:873 start_codon:yes stop_codon:yes gene_type:complete
MITLFATPKNFTGIYKIIQKNALKSWRSLSPNIQIIIFGDSDGSKEISDEINAEYVPNVRCSPQGTPYLSDLFKKADQLAKFPIMTFINADIILPEIFIEKVRILTNYKKNFLMVGHRWDMDVNYLIDFNNYKEQNSFWEEARKNSIKHGCTGIDYFIFRRFQWRNIPDFAIGRPGYDNWLLWNARRHLIHVIDATEDIMVVHQNHDYKFHNITKDPKLFNEPDGIMNREIYKKKILNLLDTNYKLVNDKILKKKSKEYRFRNLSKLPIIFPELSILLYFYKKIYNRLYK